MRLLVVEDNAQLSQLLAKGLQTAGYETDLLATAAEARTALLTTSYAALILDLGLPDGDGLSVLRELRHRKDPISVLVLTARGGLQESGQRFAQRRRRLSGEALRPGRIGRPAGSAAATARSVAWQF